MIEGSIPPPTSHLGDSTESALVTSTPFSTKPFHNNDFGKQLVVLESVLN
jgi:hypothetical protein